MTSYDKGKGEMKCIIILTFHFLSFSCPNQDASLSLFPLFAFLYSFVFYSFILFCSVFLSPFIFLFPLLFLPFLSVLLSTCSFPSLPFSFSITLHYEIFLHLELQSLHLAVEILSRTVCSAPLNLMRFLRENPAEAEANVPKQVFIGVGNFDENWGYLR